MEVRKLVGTSGETSFLMIFFLSQFSGGGEGWLKPFVAFALAYLLAFVEIQLKIFLIFSLIDQLVCPSDL